MRPRRCVVLQAYDDGEQSGPDADGGRDAGTRFAEFVLARGKGPANI
jgi:hypothetical protein